MPNSLDRGLEQALSELETQPVPPQPTHDPVQVDTIERSDHFHLRHVDHEVRSIRRTLRRQWIAILLLAIGVVGSVGLSLLT